MSDPLAGTNTRNLLQHIVSPKIVTNGAGGYDVKTDIINVDNLAISGAFRELGTGRAGFVTFTAGIGIVAVECPTLKSNSVILITPYSRPLGTLWVLNRHSAPTPAFVIYSSELSENVTVGYFVIDTA